MILWYYNEYHLMYTDGNTHLHVSQSPCSVDNKQFLNEVSVWEKATKTQTC